MGSLERLARRYNGKQFNVIGISTDDDGRAAARFIKRSRITFENFLDSKVLLENMLGADTIPLTVLVDAQGACSKSPRGIRLGQSETVDAIGQAFHIKLPR